MVSAGRDAARRHGDQRRSGRVNGGRRRPSLRDSGPRGQFVPRAAASARRRQSGSQSSIYEPCTTPARRSARGKMTATSISGGCSRPRREPPWTSSRSRRQGWRGCWRRRSRRDLGHGRAPSAPEVCACIRQPRKPECREKSYVVDGLSLTNKPLP